MIVPGKKEHYVQVAPREPLKAPAWDDFAQQPCHEAYAAIRPDGSVVGMVGAFELWPGVARAWAVVDGRASPREVAPLVAFAHEWLVLCRYHRVETTVDAHFVPGMVFAEHLGMTLEGLLRKYAPDGADHLMYAYVK